MVGKYFDKLSTGQKKEFLPTLLCIFILFYKEKS